MPLSDRRTRAGVAAILAVTAAGLVAMGRAHLQVRRRQLWHGVVACSENSQHIENTEFAINRYRSARGC